jgi:hypothetical protein
MGAIALFIQTVWLSAPGEVSAIVPLAFTVIVPDVDVFTQGPDVVIVYTKAPDSVGVPLIVNTPALNTPVTPAGKLPAVRLASVALPPTE